jgi:hypothetical protein
MLAHSLKPVQLSQTTMVNTSSLTALPTIHAFGDGSGNNGSGLNFLTPNNQSNFGSPLLRSGSS